MKTLHQKVVVITGAASGIGQALARAIAARGAVLALVDIDESGLQAISEELSKTGSTVSSHRADVSDRASMEQLPSAIVTAHGSIDVLINNAGVSVGAMFDDHSIEDAEWLLDINLKGLIYGCKFFLPYLKQSPEAHIVNLSSMFGFFSMPGQAMYSASKAGVRGFSEALWTELASTTVRVTTVHPGTIRSNVIRTSRMLDADAQAKASELQEKYGMPTDKAAEKIVRAVERKKLRVIVGADAHIAEFLKRIFPVSFQRFIGFFFR
ncbi:SDR family NAD(P)-dependent oxidoreductase [Candidatus Marimicrobium litorale]|uniref:SDR family NAD(P)-dependent oxidoreductase n=1 Tax=Candidatus Marimicrobium litorale TaxID=2518991 RepID=A0ABT3T9A5_9GAMM|nr:SDR family NAD(P)-dependent oxidoreductase [Candidatus Marimicrobium litorale]MCX2978867.1 SDR family NAD(P)-dependent oxidoreductase [Candidatus Marimicrobium litorale]